MVVIDGLTINPLVTLDRVVDAVHRRMTTLDNPGFCVRCAIEADGCDPDAQRYRCEACGQYAVFGADELLVAMM